MQRQTSVQHILTFDCLFKQRAQVTDKTIGFAPYGAYKQTKYGDDGEGWDGAIHTIVYKSRAMLKRVIIIPHFDGIRFPHLY
ncbi:hypothetical protein [Legionella clemsonensis]|uniref:Uncharacterized protein n=1 Tax=Legionella clemsonensis TaxID=1867846 RepID=A0A222NYH2_9GAMM|nr:hypothetical protein [Legionella clemsonensis]ASQ44644.1 hypothetical protein clem_00390 [Legionella clemsonensis]